MSQKFWIGVACKEHVRRGQEGRFCQLSHGKAAPVRRIRPGDWLIYYSPRMTMKAGKPVQAFTAIGQVADHEPYEVRMEDGFCPLRRDIEYLQAEDAPIRPLLAKLHFTRGSASWGLALRRGLFEISAEDFDVIASAMECDIPSRPLERRSA